MLALRASILAATDISLDSQAAAILNTWNTSNQACSANTCSACLSNYTQCGSAVNTEPTCNWMYIECSGGSVTNIGLSE